MREHRSEDRTTGDSGQIDRRHFLGVGTGVGLTLLAGCTGQSDGGTSGDDGTTDSETSAVGSFRLLISDQPADIGDFDSLNVSFDRARIFGGQAGDEEEDQAENETETQDDDTEDDDAENESEIQDGDDEPETQNETNETETQDDDEPRDTEDEENEEEDEQEAEDGEGGFSIIDLDGATVDLTEVVGDKAMSVFDGELSEGRYSKIELYASNVEGIVDGESVNVMIPSGKLQIVKPFEITADEPVSFVFDINVVKKGRSGEYNLLPVISKSGVAGKDVDVEEVGEGRGNDSDDDENETEEQDADDEDETNSTADGDDTNNTAEGGNETDDEQ